MTTKKKDNTKRQINKTHLLIAGCMFLGDFMNLTTQVYIYMYISN